MLSDQVRDHQRMRESIGIDTNAVAVTAGHPAVRVVAESGEPIVLGPRMTQPRERSGSSRPRSGSYAGRSSGGAYTGRTGTPRTGAPRTGAPTGVRRPTQP